MHIFVSVFAAIVAAGWFLSWCERRKNANQVARGLQLLHPDEPYEAKKKSDLPGFLAVVCGALAVYALIMALGG